MKKEKLIRDAVEKLRDLQESGDTEQAHYEADDVLLDILDKTGFSQVVEEYNEILKWYA